MLILGIILLGMIAATAFPQIATVSPLYLLLRALGLRDTWLALVLADASFTLPLVIWLLAGFIREIPRALEEAGAVDGAGRLGVLRWVVLPLVAPGMASAGLLAFLFSWNEFLFAYSFTASEASRTVPVALALFPIAQISRFTRASMLEVTRKDYIRTAQSKGLKERTIVVIHMIRNALIPVVTILGPLLAFLITGSFIIETIFSVPGIGRYYVISIGQRDYGVIMAMTMLYAGAIAVLNLVVDVLYAYIDPRIRYS